MRQRTTKILSDARRRGAGLAAGGAGTAAGEAADHRVLAEGIVVGRIMKAAAGGNAVAVDTAYGQHEVRTPTRGYEATREAAIMAFAQELAA